MKSDGSSLFALFELIFVLLLCSDHVDRLFFIFSTFCFVVDDEVDFFGVVGFGDDDDDDVVGLLGAAVE